MSQSDINKSRSRQDEGAAAEQLTPLQRALLALDKMGAKLTALERARSEPVAVIGLGCRFPGGGGTPESFWRMLKDGVDGVVPIPAERWPAGAIPGHQLPVKWAGLLDSIDTFDAAFFGISPREALSLDPQQRLLLEVVWEALEGAGLRSDKLAGSRTGVFVGLCNLDYRERVLRKGIARLEVYDTLGTLASTAAGRLSYILGLQGPSLMVDTACSSSLVAVHLACQSVRSGESEIAIAAGVNAILDPWTMMLAAQTQAMAPDGRCKTFDASANGFVRGEGCGVVVLKRQADALRDGDRIHALIRGSCVNQDGRSSGLTAPNVLAQKQMLQQALKEARVSGDQIGYVEAHGTGTSLGDPIEVEALGSVLGRGERRCVLGALKTQIGHLEAAAGIAGLIKAILCLTHEAIPANLHFQTLNPRISIDNTRFVIPTRPLPWPRGEDARLAGVSSFGISGTNAHVVLEEAPKPAERAAATAREAELVVLSARSEAALQAQATRLREHLRAHPEQSLGDIAYSLAATRSEMDHRLAIATTGIEDLQAKLFEVEKGGSPLGAVRGRLPVPPGKLAFLFTGQGAQYAGMGQGLYQEWPAFRQVMDRCTSLFNRELPIPLLDVMFAQPAGAQRPQIDQTLYTQPALFALEYALYELWASWGVTPDLVAGHSIGELVAACAAGVLTLEDGVRLCGARARLMQALPQGGAMASIGAAEAEVSAALAPYARLVSIAAVNGSRQVVISGEQVAVKQLAREFSLRGVRVKELQVSHAFHSPLMQPMLDEFRKVAKGITYQRPKVPLMSNLLGKESSEEVCTAEYWVSHVREAVRFAAGITALYAGGVRTFVEVGPKGTLLGLADECLAEKKCSLVPSLQDSGGKARVCWRRLACCGPKERGWTGGTCPPPVAAGWSCRRMSGSGSGIG